MQRLRKPKTPTTKRLRPAAIMAVCPLSPPQHFGMIEKNMSTMDDPQKKSPWSTGFVHPMVHWFIRFRPFFPWLKVPRWGPQKTRPTKPSQVSANDVGILQQTSRLVVSPPTYAGHWGSGLEKKLWSTSDIAMENKTFTDGLPVKEWWLSIAKSWFTRRLNPTISQYMPYDILINPNSSWLNLTNHPIC